MAALSLHTWGDEPGASLLSWVLSQGSQQVVQVVMEGWPGTRWKPLGSRRGHSTCCVWMSPGRGPWHRTTPGAPISALCTAWGPCGGPDGWAWGGVSSHHRKFKQRLRFRDLMAPLPHSSGFTLFVAAKLLLIHSLSHFIFCIQGAQKPTELHLGDPGHRGEETRMPIIVFLF